MTETYFGSDEVRPTMNELYEDKLIKDNGDGTYSPIEDSDDNVIVQICDGKEIVNKIL